MTPELKGIWTHPEGLKVEPDGTWRVGELPVIHPPSLRYLKQHLVFEDDTAWLVDGGQRLAVDVRGPAFHAVSLVLDPSEGVARVVLDDGSDEQVDDADIGMSELTGRFECLVRSGHARAVLSRGAHQVLLEHVVDDGGVFVLRVGERAIRIRT